MSAAVLPPLTEVHTDVRKRFSRSEVEQMFDSGIFEGQRLELIDGDLIDKMGQNPPHASVIRRLAILLAQIFGMERILNRAPVDVAPADRERNFPEPDLAILIENKPDFDSRHPFGNELLLLVEVAQTSLDRDTSTKRDLYARAGVPEYWVVDLPGRQVIVHRAPSGGAYSQVSVFSGDEAIAPESQPGHPIPVSKILP